MNAHRLLLVVGSGLSAFLVVTAIVSTLLEPVIGFSVFIGIPVGLVAAVAAIAAAHAALGRAPSRLRSSAFVAVASFGYAIVGLSAVSYAIPATRQTLDVPVVLVLAAAVAVFGSVLGWMYPVTSTGRR